MQSYVDSYITSHNVRLLSVKEGDVNLNDFSDSLVASIKSQVNDNQINTTREKSKQAMAKLRDAGEYFPCSRLYGIIYEGGKNRVIKVDPEKAKVIRFVFEETAKMRPYNAIIRDMNQKFAGLQLGRVFYESNFRHIAKQSFYAGYVTDSNGNLVKSKQMEGKEIISLALWQKVQEIMSRNRRAPQRRKSILHPFSQLLYCGYCGSRLIVNVDKGKECYICKSSNLQQRGDCSKARVNINLKRHSDQFIGLHNCLSPLLVLAMYREMERNDISNSKRGKLIGLQNRLSELQTRKDNFIADLPNSVLPREDFNRAVLAFRNEIAKVTKEIAEIEHAMTNKQEVHKKAKLFFANLDMILNDKLEEGVYEDLLRSSVNKIRCFNDRLEIETIYGDFTLKRYMVKQYRNFPRFTFEYNEEALKKLDVKNADIKVTYLYGNEEVAKLNVDLECMRIYEK